MGLLASIFGCGKQPQSQPPSLLPAYDVDSILAKPTASESVYALIDAIDARQTQKLIGREKDIYWPYHAHVNIFRDGINGTLHNYGLVMLTRSVDGMENIGATNRARIVRQAIESFGGPDVVAELSARFPVDVITPGQRKLFDKLDGEYYHVANEDFYELVVAYMRLHTEEFKGYKIAQPAAAGNSRPAGQSSGI